MNLLKLLTQWIEVLDSHILSLYLYAHQTLENCQFLL